MNTPRKIIVHHTSGTANNPFADTSHHTAEIIDEWHKTRWPGFTSKVFENKRGYYYHVGYHYVIEKDGTIVQTRTHSEEGAHCIGYNASSIGICLTGNFDVRMPTKEQTDSFIHLFKKIKTEYPNITAYDIEPHRKYANKSCYGYKLSDDYFQGIVTEKQGITTRIEQKEIYDNRTTTLKLIELLRQKLAILTVLVTKQRMKLGKY